MKIRSDDRPPSGGRTTSKNYKPNNEIDLPADKDFFQRAKDVIRGDQIHFKELDALLKYISPDPYGSEGPRLEEVFTTVETFHRWFQFGEKVIPDITKQISAFFPPLPYLPFSPVLDSLVHGPRELDRFSHRYFEYDVSKLVEHQLNLASQLSSAEKTHVGDGFALLRVSFEAIRSQLKDIVYRVLKNFGNADGGLFVDYSLPQTDFHANWLFQVASSRRRGMQPVPVIEIGFLSRICGLPTVRVNSQVCDTA